jgi:phosphoribosylaminoimidazole-succinocarboxamide synthase
MQQNQNNSISMQHQALTETNFQLPGLKSMYRGKVRDVYFLGNDRIALVATDRISAFDVVLPKGIPGKGQVLNQIAAYFLNATTDIVPNWLEDTVHPQVSVGLWAEPFKVEMVVRGCLTGHAWRTYKSGARILCGISLPEGMVENQPFDHPIITPTTKAEQGKHDEDISREEILSRGIVSESDYRILEEYSLALFARGQTMAAERGLVLADTKYEFGKTRDGKIILIDEIHTPDSSRYFIAAGFDEQWKRGEAVRQLSKEFVRQWLIENGFSGKEGQQIPEMNEVVVESIRSRYAELFEKIVGIPFVFKSSGQSLHKDIEAAIVGYLSKI